MLKKNYPLSYLGILSRGKISYFADVKSKQELIKIFENKDKDIPVYIIGNGSNTVASDGYIKGMAIKLSGEFNRVSVKEEEVLAGAGVDLKELINILKEKGLSGIEFLYGIPGTVGGAVKMNAGCFGDEIMRHITCIEVFSKGRIIKRKKFSFSYRKGPLRKGEILLFASMKLKKKNKRIVENSIRRFLRLRLERNLYYRNSKGSVFMNLGNLKAYKIIEGLNLKKMSQGNVKLWDKNPNFFIWSKDAGGEDFFKLYSRIKRIVEEKKGIKLKSEITFIGL